MATDRQVAALKYVVFESKEISDLAKRLIATMLDNSEGLKRAVQANLVVNERGFTDADMKALRKDFSVSTSCLCSLHFNELLQLAGSDFSFGNSYDEKGHAICIGPRRNTPMKILRINRAKLAKIDLGKPGLYPGIEKSEFKKAG